MGSRTNLPRDARVHRERRDTSLVPMEGEYFHNHQYILISRYVDHGIDSGTAYSMRL